MRKKKKKNIDYRRKSIDNSKLEKIGNKDKEKLETFDFENYILRIQKFIEGEIDHLNKFKYFVNDFKEKSSDFIKYYNLNEPFENKFIQNSSSQNSENIENGNYRV